jgi:hypothetical protein
MTESRYRESLKKVGRVITCLDPDKQVAATKWLEGVIVAQTLTTGEREDIVKAANDYVETLGEEEYVGAVNALIGYLEHVQKRANRTLKRNKGKNPAKSRSQHK